MDGHPRRARLRGAVRSAAAEPLPPRHARSCGGVPTASRARARTTSSRSRRRSSCRSVFGGSSVTSSSALPELELLDLSAFEPVGGVDIARRARRSRDGGRWSRRRGVAALLLIERSQRPPHQGRRHGRLRASGRDDDAVGRAGSLVHHRDDRLAVPALRRGRSERPGGPARDHGGRRAPAARRRCADRRSTCRSEACPPVADRWPCSTSRSCSCPDRPPVLRSSSGRGAATSAWSMARVASSLPPTIASRRLPTDARHARCASARAKATSMQEVAPFTGFQPVSTGSFSPNGRYVVVRYATEHRPFDGVAIADFAADRSSPCTASVETTRSPWHGVPDSMLYLLGPRRRHAIRARPRPHRPVPHRRVEGAVGAGRVAMCFLRSSCSRSRTKSRRRQSRPSTSRRSGGGPSRSARRSSPAPSSSPGTGRAPRSRRRRRLRRRRARCSVRRRGFPTARSAADAARRSYPAVLISSDATSLIVLSQGGAFEVDVAEPPDTIAGYVARPPAHGRHAHQRAGARVLTRLPRRHRTRQRRERSSHRVTRSGCG